MSQRTEPGGRRAQTGKLAAHKVARDILPATVHSSHVKGIFTCHWGGRLAEEAGGREQEGETPSLIFVSEGGAALGKLSSGGELHDLGAVALRSLFDLHDLAFILVAIELEPRPPPQPHFQLSGLALFTETVLVWSR